MPFPIVKTFYQLNNDLLGNSSATAAPAPLLGKARVGLGAGIITPNLFTTWTLCDEATYTGYSESAVIVWTLPINDVDLTPTIESPSYLFRCTGTSSIAVANGFLSDGIGVSSVTGIGSSSTGILGSCIISPAFNFVNPGDGFSAIVDWNNGPGQSANTQLTIVY